MFCSISGENRLLYIPPHAFTELPMKRNVVPNTINTTVDFIFLCFLFYFSMVRCDALVYRCSCRESNLHRGKWKKTSENINLLKNVWKDKINSSKKKTSENENIYYDDYFSHLFCAFYVVKWYFRAYVRLQFQWQTGKQKKNVCLHQI